MKTLGSQAFLGIGDEKLVEIISATQQRLLFAAPGVSDKVAGAIAEAWKRLPGRVTVVLDVDPTICRLGYGTVKGLELLQQTAINQGTMLCQERGLRIGVVISDNFTVVFSPTPLLIESGVDREQNSGNGQDRLEGGTAIWRPNGIILQTVPDEIAKHVGWGEKGIEDRTLGLDQVPAKLIADVKTDLEANPPAKFDLARKLLVFTQKFQFVEFALEDCFISQKTVRIPNELVGLLRNDKLKQQLEDRVATTFKLIGQSDLEFVVESESEKSAKTKVSEKILRRTKNDIIKRHLTHLPDYGTVIHKANKAAFDAQTEELRKLVKSFQTGLRKNVQKIIERNREDVLEWLLPVVLENPPTSLTKIHGPHPGKKAIKGYLTNSLSDVFGTVDDLVSKMAVRVTYKDVTWESLNDPNFIEIARKAMPTLDNLFDEFKVVEGEELAASSQD